MKRKPKNRHGVTTIFLAIILSSLILIESLFVYMNISYDRAVRLQRAATAQIEAYLAEYDRQLLKTYGLYAFDLYDTDDSVFHSVMDGNYIDETAQIYIDRIEEPDSHDMRMAISTFYAYRSPGIAINRFSDVIRELLDEIGATGIPERVKTLMSSRASSILMDIIDGNIDVANTLMEAGETFDCEEEDVEQFNSLIDSYDELLSGPLDSDDSFDPSEPGFIIDGVELISGFYDAAADLINNYAFHPFAAHYAAYNFDSVLDDDAAIDGTEFDVFHDDNLPDSEYIITGLEDEAASDRIGIYTYSILLINRIVQTYNDRVAMAVISVIATVLSILVSVISVGTVTLPESLYKAIITVLYSAVSAKADLSSLLEGEQVTVGAVRSFEGIEMGYRDFLFIFALFSSDEYLLERSCNVLSRDFENYAVGVKVAAECASCPQFSIERRYELYES